MKLLTLLSYLLQCAPLTIPPSLSTYHTGRRPLRLASRYTVVACKNLPSKYHVSWSVTALSPGKTSSAPPPDDSSIWNICSTICRLSCQKHKNDFPVRFLVPHGMCPFPSVVGRIYYPLSPTPFILHLRPPFYSPSPSPPCREIRTWNLRTGLRRFGCPLSLFLLAPGLHNIQCRVVDLLTRKRQEWYATALPYPRLTSAWSASPTSPSLY
jgi:hypothetical protein